MSLPLAHQLLTAQFRLRAPRESDIPFIFSASRFAGFNDGMLWEPPESMDVVEDSLRRSIQAWEKGEGYNFTVDDRKSDRPLARASIRRTAESDVWDIGFWTHPEHQGRGVMTEAVAAILRLGFEELGATRIEACHATWNGASKRVLEKNGFQFVRHIEQGFQKRGVWVAENMLAIDRAQWEKAG